ncbi:MAG TPA: aspartate-semialdehyde dehydrogenase [Candidatus Saccharimonadales bacterium]
MKRLRAGIIGATGMVGQRFITLLEDHPRFEVVSLSASSRSAGQTYRRAVDGRWKLALPCPSYAEAMIVQDAVADLQTIAQSVDLVFCALDMDKAAILELENNYAAAGVAVISNNSAHRWTDDVPMLIPEVNPDHAGLIDIQRRRRGWTTGLIAVKPNCSIQSYTMVLAALKSLHPESVHVTSLQAVSGAGRTLADWPEITDNLIPFINGEEEKSEREPLKIMGSLKNGGIEPATVPAISATCIRVPVSDGHLADVSIRFGAKTTKADLLATIDNFDNPIAHLKLPSSPSRLFHYFEDNDRPQPKTDRDYANGMGVTLGRLRELPPDNPYDWRFISLAHNTIRGAAGGAILMAELLTSQGYIKAKK